MHENGTSHRGQYKHPSAAHPEEAGSFSPQHQPLGVTWQTRSSQDWSAWHWLSAGTHTPSAGQAHRAGSEQTNGSTLQEFAIHLANALPQDFVETRSTSGSKKS